MLRFISPCPVLPFVLFPRAVVQSQSRRSAHGISLCRVYPCACSNDARTPPFPSCYSLPRIVPGRSYGSRFPQCDHGPARPSLLSLRRRTPSIDRRTYLRLSFSISRLHNNASVRFRLSRIEVEMYDQTTRQTGSDPTQRHIAGCNLPSYVSCCFASFLLFRVFMSYFYSIRSVAFRFVKPTACIGCPPSPPLHGSFYLPSKDIEIAWQPFFRQPYCV